MRNYKIMISSNRKPFLIDPKSNMHFFLNGAMYFINSVGERTYFAKGTREFRTIEEGSWYHLDGRYILCNEDVIHHIYE